MNNSDLHKRIDKYLGQRVLDIKTLKQIENVLKNPEKYINLMEENKELRDKLHFSDKGNRSEVNYLKRELQNYENKFYELYELFDSIDNEFAFNNKKESMSRADICEYIRKAKEIYFRDIL